MGVIGSSGTPRYDYHPASEFAGGKVGALWDVPRWRRWLFQDSAATIPVTASGQPVGCIKNVLGDASWDFIQATSGSRPTFLIIGGVPRVFCDLNQGMYSRGVQSLVIPAFFACGFRRTTGPTQPRVILGIYRNDNNYFYLSDSTVVTVAADTTGVSPPKAVPRKTATGPQWSYPTNATDSASVLIDAAGLMSVRQNDEFEAIATQGSPGGIDIATGWASGDTVPTMTLCLNAAAQNGITKVSTPNADTSLDFFGGMVLMGSAPANRSGCQHYFRRHYKPIETPRNARPALSRSWPARISTRSCCSSFRPSRPSRRRESSRRKSAAS
jgi:hypothetical protein